MTCRWTGTTTPRTLVGRHHDACPDPDAWLDSGDGQEVLL